MAKISGYNDMIRQTFEEADMEQREDKVKQFLPLCDMV